MKSGAFLQGVSKIDRPGVPLFRTFTSKIEFNLKMFRIAQME